MDAPSRQPDASVVDRLRREPFHGDFFQAVRVVEAAWRAQRDGTPARSPVGYDGSPAQETLRFALKPTLGFPSAPVSEVAVEGDGEGEGAAWRHVAVTASFVGLTGVCGVLPYHYTQELIDRRRRQDDSLRAFLDLFNHRLISYFYRAWEKYRFPPGYERAHTDRTGRFDDTFTEVVFCLTGHGTAGTRGRLKVDDEVWCLYSGLFSDRHRSATSLERLLASYLELEVSVLQFRGRWLALDAGDVSCLPAPSRGAPGRNLALGATTVLGTKIWDVQSGFRVRLGPLTYSQYCSLLPGEDAQQRTLELVRSYVGPEYDFDIQPVLTASEVPECELRGDLSPGPRLGWTTWLRTEQPYTHDFDEAAFVSRDF